LKSREKRTAMLVGLIVVAPTIALMLGNEQRLVDAVPVAGMASYALVLGAAVLIYFHWRLTAERRAGTISRRLVEWLLLGLTIAAVDGLLQLTAVTPEDDMTTVVAQLVLTLVLCVLAAVSERLDVPCDPAVAGTAAAALLIVAYTLVLRLAPPIVLTGDTAALVNASVLVAGLLLALIVLNRTRASLWARRRVASAAVLLTVGQCATNLDSSHDGFMVLAIVAFIFGALTLCLMSTRMLRSSLQEQVAEVELLQRTLAEVRSAVLEDRELLHEVGATLAGLTTASELMRGGQRVPARRRRRLEAMLGAELARLGRLMAHRAGDGGAGEDLPMRIDDIVGPIVVSHQERQRTVVWSPSGEEAYGDPDELAEICNILLENAACHAHGAAVRLSVAAQGEEVVVVCSDDGPGVPPELRHRIFDPEAKGARSSGQGLGLAIARRLASARGGSLELAELGAGATFVARLPRKVTADVAAGHVA
jgi:signal transduction histidine kinase